MENREEIFRKLAALGNQVATEEDFGKFTREVSEEKNDRGAAILLATNVENALEIALSRRFKQNPKQLFGVNDPLGTFESKIRIAYALEIFRKNTRNNIHTIQKIRNAFAHAKRPISFSDLEVSEACNLISMQVIIDRKYPEAVNEPDPEYERLTGRERYTHICNVLTANLYHYAMDALQVFPWFSVPQSLEAKRYQILVRPIPLP